KRASARAADGPGLTTPGQAPRSADPDRDVRDGMKTLRIVALAAALALGAQSRPAAAEALPAPPVCGRACLEGFIDRYLQALVAHDPARLPLVRDVKFTENGSTLKLGDGLWGTVQALGD